VSVGADPLRESANDAQLVELVRGALGRHPGSRRGRPRINISSCSFVVTLHGVLESAEVRDGIEAAPRAVPAVREVTSKLMVDPG